MSTSDVTPPNGAACSLQTESAYDTIKNHLGMKHTPVGVRFIFDEQALADAQLPPRPDRPKWYCQMVMEAAAGKYMTACIEDMSCPNSELSLGFRKPKYTKIETGFKELTRAVVVGPLDNADVILLILNNRQTMTMSILMGGISAEFRGEVAVCGEATAQVYKEGIPNLSFLCNGARMFGGYKDSEVVLGMPPVAAEHVAGRINAQRKSGGALCGCIVSDLPPEITANFKSIGFEKGADYFFGRIGANNVRVYLEKDDKGRIERITLYVLEKAPLEGVTVLEPFTTRAREGWIDILASFDPHSIGADLCAGGEKLKNTFAGMLDKYIIREK